MTYDRHSDLPQRSGSFHAVVRAGNSVTAYLRIGKGQPVVLLRRADHADALWGVVLAEIGHGFRAIVPEQIPSASDFASWFSLFLDGLGLGAVRVVADAHFGMCCIDAGLLHPDGITALVVVAENMDADAVAQALTARANTIAASAAIVRTNNEDAFVVAARAVDLVGRGSASAD